jgi:hypothetical protein
MDSRGCRRNNCGHGFQKGCGNQDRLDSGISRFTIERLSVRHIWPKGKRARRKYYEALFTEEDLHNWGVLQVWLEF